MAVKIRLTRLGKKKQPTYRVVVMDSRKQRDGKYIEQLGFYDPKQDPSVVEINNDRALYWLRTGAQPTERAQKLLEISGAWTQFRVAKGDIHTIGDDADAELDEKAQKKAKKAEKKARKAAEAAEAAKSEASSDDEAAEVVEAVEPEAAAEVEEETADSSEEV